MPSFMEEFALGIVWVDENGLIRFANRYAQGLTGYDREELLGLSAARLIAGRHGEQAMSEDNNAAVQTVASTAENLGAISDNLKASIARFRL